MGDTGSLFESLRGGGALGGGASSFRSGPASLDGVAGGARCPCTSLRVCVDDVGGSQLDVEPVDLEPVASDADQAGVAGRTGHLAALLREVGEVVASEVAAVAPLG